MSSPMIGVVIINRIVFSIENLSNNIFNDPDIYFALAITDGIADCTQALICSPVELIKTRLQMQDIGQQRTLFILLTHSYKKPIHCSKKSCKRRDIQRETMRGKEIDMTVYLSLIDDDFTGIAAWTVSYPFDVIKSRYHATRDHRYDIWCVLPAAFPENYELIIRDPSRPKFIISYPCSLLNLIIKDHYTNDQYHELVDKDKHIYEICLENSIFF
ncbi:unnamed protein product [Rotaria sordida]|uniref:DNA polymerase epsilon catalytic subunit n=1 Tax=Rotaria sordida TaxID=392033 RepID=A0A813PU90_9BILA|nr:unnamed protein product [Rotaria sordida]